MGTENPKPSSSYLRPTSTPFVAQSVTPFSSSRPVVGSEASAFRPSSVPPPPSTMPFVPPGPLGGAETTGFRTMQPGRPTLSSSPLPPSLHGPPTSPPFFGVPAHQSSSSAQVPSQSSTGQPVPTAAIRPPAGYMPTIPASRPYAPQPSPPMGPSYPLAARGVAPPSLPGYPSLQTNQAMQQPHVAQPPPILPQGGFIPPRHSTPPPFISHQGAYGPPASVPSPVGLYSREQMQPPGSIPPTNALQGLVEDFSSISIGAVPGSFDSGLDSKILPRPLDGDVEPKPFIEMFPMNCNSRYLRLTTSAIPTSQSLVSRWHLPLGAVACPLAEAPDGEEVPLVNFMTSGIVRCRRCRTYVNPYVTFTDSGRKWRCNICSLHNDVPSEYFAYLDATGKRTDLDQRPELTKGSVEYVAPAEYMVRPPMPPLYFFLIDVSAAAVRSGMLEVMAQTIKSCLDNLPGSSRTQIGFITFDSTIHFYNMKSSLTQPQMMVVSDLDDIFVPLPDDLLVNLSESRTVVDAFLDSLPSMFQENVNVESAFGPALKAAFMVMSQLGGKLLIFQNTLPSLGVGRLRLRGDDRVYGSDKEQSLRVPEDPFYKQMAADLTKYQIAVNIYAFSDKYTDIASLGTLAKYTGGQVYYYPNFHSAIQKEKLSHELARDLTRETAWEAVMRIRCGKGVRFTSYHGNLMLRSTDLIALPAVDCDKTYAMQFALEETMLSTPIVYFQVALLYTSSSGERRIRVHTAAAPVVTELGEMYRHADTGAIVSVLSRLAIEKSLSFKLEESRNSVQQRIVKALKEYRNLYAVQHRVGSRLIYPESLKFLVLYGLAICKSMALRGGHADAQLDERCAAGYTMMALPVKKLLKLLYPTLIRVDEYLVKGSDFDKLCKKLPVAAESLDSSGLYIYDDGFRFIIWFGRMLSPDIAMNLLGEDFSADFSRVTLRARDNELSRRLFGMLKKFREADPSYYQLCHLVRQGEQPREGFFLLANLVEDQVGGMSSYADWIMQIHRQVQQNA